MKGSGGVEECLSPTNVESTGCEYAAQEWMKSGERRVVVELPPAGRWIHGAAPSGLGLPPGASCGGNIVNVLISQADGGVYPPSGAAVPTIVRALSAHTQQHMVR